MPHLTKQYSLLLFGLIIVVLLALIVPSFFTYAADEGLVQCGRKGSPTFCTICDLVKLVQSIIQKILYYFLGPIAALMLGYGGFLMVLAGLQGGSPSFFTKGKTVLTNTGMGIVILFVSWLLIDTLLKLLGAYQHGDSKFGPWNEIECVSAEITVPNEVGCTQDQQCKPILGNAIAGCSTSYNCTEKKHLECANGMCQKKEGIGVDTCTVSPDNCPPEHYVCKGGSCVVTTDPSVTADTCNKAKGNSDCVSSGIIMPIVKQATKDLQSMGVVFSSSGDCKDINGSPVSAQTNQQQMLNEQLPTVCHATCKTDGKPCTQQGITIDGDMMYRLVKVGKAGNKFNISSLTTGAHSANSDHYQGKAVDLVATGGTTYAALKSAFPTGFGSGIKLLQCEGANGSVIANCGPGTNHLHIGYN